MKKKKIRIKKLNEAIKQQRKCHKARMEVVELEKAYWRMKTDLL